MTDNYIDNPERLREDRPLPDMPPPPLPVGIVLDDVDFTASTYSVLKAADDAVEAELTMLRTLRDDKINPRVAYLVKEKARLATALRPYEKAVAREG